MSFVRPEVIDAFSRHRIRIMAGLALLLGVLCVWRGLTTPAPFYTVLGVGICILTIALWIAHRQRAAFYHEVTQPGIVQIDEAQIRYFTPDHHDLPLGGVIDRDAITRIDLVSGGDGRARWALYHADGPPISIPLAAEGADQLLDILMQLPGIEVGAALSALNRGRPGIVSVWSRVPGGS
ncbi:MAG: hypothetical protein AAGB10_08335 [Pseudomonadota bacterium]